MSAKLVSKQQYLQSIGKRLMLYTFAAAIVGASAYLFFSAWMGTHGLVIVILVGSIAIPLMQAGAKAYQQAKQMEPVLPITQHNAHLLPVEETLVRGSSVPETQAQTELLRAAGTGVSTPEEELLRPLESQ